MFLGMNAGETGFDNTRKHGLVQSGGGGPARTDAAQVLGKLGLLPPTPSRSRRVSSKGPKSAREAGRRVPSLRAGLKPQALLFDPWGVVLSYSTPGAFRDFFASAQPR